MVGDGVLRWLIASARVDRVVAVSPKALRGGAPLHELICNQLVIQ